jgi:hypothetical protein
VAYTDKLIEETNQHNRENLYRIIGFILFSIAMLGIGFAGYEDAKAYERGEVVR